MPSFDGVTDAFTSSIVVGPLEAQKMKPNVRAVLLCEISSVSSDRDHDGATIDEPYDEYSFKYTMHVIPRGVWFFNSSTGFVLARVGVTKKAPPIAKKPGCPPTITDKPEPKYTEEARVKEIQGTVELSALFTENGEITDIRVIKDLSDGLTERAIEVAKRIKFISPTIAGKKIPCRMALEYNFNLY
jgi:TonB family protein